MYNETEGGFSTTERVNLSKFSIFWITQVIFTNAAHIVNDSPMARLTFS